MQIDGLSREGGFFVFGGSHGGKLGVTCVATVLVVAIVIVIVIVIATVVVEAVSFGTVNRLPRCARNDDNRLSLRAREGSVIQYRGYISALESPLAGASEENLLAVKPVPIPVAAIPAPAGG